MFNPRREEAVSGLPVAPPKQPRAVKEARADYSERLRKRFSQSGPLADGPQWTKSGKKLDDPQAVSTAINLSKLSGLVATRTLLSEGHQEKIGPSRSQKTEQMGRFSGSVKELQSKRKQDQNCYTQMVGDFPQIEDGKASAKESSLVSHL